MVLLAMTGALALELAVADDPRLVEQALVRRGSASWMLEDGFGFPVHTDDGAQVGLVFVGNGTHGFAFAQHGEAVRFANVLSTRGAAREDLSVAVDAGTWRESFDVALVLSSDPSLSELVAGLRPVSEERGTVSYLDDAGMEHVVVTGIRLDRARALAKRVLRERVHHLDRLGLDPRDALHHDRHDDGPARWIAEVRTERAWTPFVAPAFSTGHDRWLSFAEDATGLVDDTYRRVVFAHGLGEGEAPRWSIITGDEHESEPGGARVTRGTANAVFHATPSGRDAILDVEALLTVDASRATALLPLAIPHRRSEAPYGTPPQPDDFEVVAVELADGTALPTHPGIFGRPGLAHDPDLVMAVLPTPVGPEHTAVVRVLTRDRWEVRYDLEVRPWAAKILHQRGVCRTITDCSAVTGNLPELADLGTVAEPRPVLPVVAGQRGRYPVELRVGSELGKAWAAVPGGGTIETRAVEGASWRIATTTSDAQLGFGKLRSERAAPMMGMPGVDLRTWQAGAAGSPPEIRSIIHFFDAMLPAYPYSEVQVIHGRDRAFLYSGSMSAEERTPALQPPSVVSAPGQLVIQGVREVNVAGVGASLERRLRNRFPRAVERGLAEGIAAHWWIQPDYRTRDAWIGAAMPAVYRDLFVETAFPAQVAKEWSVQMDGRESLERGGPRPLAGPPAEWTAERGARLFGAALRERIGDRPLLVGLDRFLSGSDHTTEALRAALEHTSGSDLQGFFDVWVYTGPEPAVDLEWRLEGPRLVGVVTADVPFGTWSVPVVVRTGRGSQQVWVDVVDGSGELEVLVRGALKGVDVDPEGWLPLRRRRARRARGASAEGPEAVAPGASELL